MGDVLAIIAIMTCVGCVSYHVRDVLATMGGMC